MKKTQKKAFTLVEMMIVVAIIAVLAGIAVPQYNKYVKKSETTEAIRFMKQIIDAQAIYFSTHGKFVDNNSSNNSGLNIIGTEINTNGKFTKYEVTACDATDKNDGVIVRAWLGADSAATNTNSVWMFYPSNLNPTNYDTAVYDGTALLYNYINEDTGVSYIPSCP